MDETVRRLETPEECEQFIKNVQEKYPTLALEARRKKVEMLSEKRGAQTATEQKMWEALYAYEEVLSVIALCDGGSNKKATTFI